MTQTPVEMLLEFHAAAGQQVPSTPTVTPGPGFTSSGNRVAMILSEVDELGAACADGNLVEIADACADILYAVYGCAVSHGLPIEEVFAEVHRSNMTKIGPGGPVVDAAGKIVKGPGYERPVLGPILENARRRAGRR